MRTLLVVFMIALLPLRGWVGDAMALSMVSGHAPDNSASVVASPAPCHGTVASTDAQAHDASHGLQEGAAHTHLLCDLCNGPAMVQRVSWTALTAELPRLVPAVLARFASQDARRDVRPPIA